MDNYNALTYASVPKIILKKKISILNELINAYDNYYNNTPPALSLTEVQKIFPGLTSEETLNDEEE